MPGGASIRRAAGSKDGGRNGVPAAVPAVAGRRAGCLVVNWVPRARRADRLTGKPGVLATVACLFVTQLWPFRAEAGDQPDHRAARGGNGAAGDHLQQPGPRPGGVRAGGRSSERRRLAGARAVRAQVDLAADHRGALAPHAPAHDRPRDRADDPQARQTPVHELRLPRVRRPSRRPPRRPSPPRQRDATNHRSFDPTRHPTLDPALYSAGDAARNAALRARARRNRRARGERASRFRSGVRPLGGPRNRRGRPPRRGGRPARTTRSGSSGCCGATAGRT